MSTTRLNILFVCMGNICRSPTAEGVFRQRLIDHQLQHLVRTDSAGTHNYHPHSPPDARSQRHARQRGYDLSDLRARQITPNDFEVFDLILTMDEDNLHHTLAVCPKPLQHKVQAYASLLRRHTASHIPDPYYGGADGFSHVLDLIEDASDTLLDLAREQVDTFTTRGLRSAEAARNHNRYFSSAFVLAKLDDLIAAKLHK